jgi:ABC-type bacteriocin/lantibiotic exporter with double-glycine peptidase domain
MKNILMTIIVLILLFGLYYKSCYINIEKLPCSNCIIQNKRMNCGPAALKMIFKDFNIHLSLETIENETNFDKKKGVTLLDLYTYCERMGLKPKGLRVSEDSLKACIFPSIIYISNSHFVVIDSLDARNYCYLRDPARGRMKLPVTHLSKMWNGEILSFQK